MKNVGLKMAVFVLLSLVSAMNVPAMADSVGVKRGDFAKYEFAYLGEPPLGAPQPIDWLKLEFLEIDYHRETSARVRVTLKFADGDESTPLTSGVELFESNWMHTGFVIPANSKIGDTVAVEGIWNGRDPSVQAEITGEETRTSLGVNRTVVYANYSVNGNSHIETISNKVYWDKQTGVLVEGSYLRHGDESSWTVIVELTDCAQRMWPHDFLSLELERWQLVTIIVFFGGAATTAIALILYRRKPTEGEPLPPPSSGHSQLSQRQS
jgi:hypothetical protein